MGNFGDELRGTPVEKPKSTLRLLHESHKLMKDANKMLKDYVSDEMRLSAKNAIGAFRAACTEEAKRGKRSIVWTGDPKKNQGSVSIGRASPLNMLIGFDSSGKREAETIKRLIEEELATMGLHSYRVGIVKKTYGYPACQAFCFQIHARW